MSGQKLSGKAFVISKQEVAEAWQKVKARQGAPGADGVTLGEFESDLKNNLYRIWNRMSSGTYFPPPVKAVEIPKPHGGGTRMLGVPTIADRIAQTVAARRLEEKAEPVFHPGSWGYRPGRAALDAVAACRENCWRYDWVIALDIQAFFDSVPWDLVLKAVRHHTDEKTRWVVMYVQRWLAAPLALPDGTLRQRDRGTPQGSAISPMLANLFLHYAFDAWMAREYPGLRFERYADDVVVHCASLEQAQRVLAAIGARMQQVGLRLHPAKTQIVYCQDSNRRGSHERTAFTFLGFTFRARRAKGRNGRSFTALLPALSKDALNKISARVRDWRLHRRTSATLEDLARLVNPVVRGWMQYYGQFYRSALYRLLQRINTYLVRWLRNKYKRLRKGSKAQQALQGAAQRHPWLLAHWTWVTTASAAW